MSSTVTTTTGSIVVVTHIHLPTEQDKREQVQHNGGSHWAQPLALGTVQIMIGVMVVLLGIPLSVHGGLLGYYTGMYFWGGFTYITAGAVTVAASRSVERHLINGSLILNITSAIFSFAGVILSIMDFMITLGYSHRDEGSTGVLAFFHLVQFLVSIIVTGVGRRVTCSCNEKLLSSVTLHTHLLNGEDEAVKPLSANSSVNSEAPPTYLQASQVPQEMEVVIETSEEPTASDDAPADDPPAFTDPSV